jgi:rhamnosyltransferase
LSSVCAIIVTYNPGADLLRNVLLLRKQVSGVLIVDNASSEAALGRIREVQEQTSCLVFDNDHNLGIAAALNIGFRFAIDNQYDWIIAFDQDSTITDGFVQALVDVSATASAPSLICPTYIDRSSMTEMVMPKLPSGEPLIAMTSGSMFPRSTYLRAGPFDERLYIDSVDNEYCLRIRSLGMHIAQAERAVLLHSLGKITSRRFFGKKLIATNHSPARRYYMTRNRLYLLFRYPRDRRWILLNICQMAQEFAAILLVERQKLAKIGYMIRGAVDFTRGRWGRQVPL